MKLVNIGIGILEQTNTVRNMLKFGQKEKKNLVLAI